MSTISILSAPNRASCSARPIPRRKRLGWTPDRRARQAALIRRVQPWRRSTGPRTDAGKARVAMNALRHGYRSRAWLELARRIRRAIRMCAGTVLLVRVLMRQGDRALAPDAPHIAPAMPRQWQSPPPSCMRG